MGSLSQVQSTREHCEYLAEHLRSGEALELSRSHECSALDVLLSGFLGSELCLTVLTPSGRPMAMWGLARTDPLWCQVWLLGTPDVETYRFAFLRGARRVLPRVLTVYPWLYQYVDAEYKASLKWLAWLGFRIAPPEPWGPRGAMFCRVERTVTPWVGSLGLV